MYPGASQASAPPAPPADPSQRSLLQAQQIQSQLSTRDLLGCEVTIFLAFAHLRSADVLSKSDPFAVVSSFDNATHSWRPLGKTETIQNASDGSWVTTFNMRFVFEEQQPLRVEVWDHDSLSKHDFLGQAEFTLGDAMGCPGQTQMLRLVKPNKKDKERGSIIVHIERQGDSLNDAKLRLQLSGTKFDSKDWGGLRASDPYFVIQRRVNGNLIKVHQSEWIRKNNSPVWKEVEIRMDKLCRGNTDEVLEITVYDYDDGTSDDLIGSCTLSVNQLIEAAKNRTTFQVVHPPTKKKYRKSSYKHSGLLNVLNAAIIKSPTAEMLEFIEGGLSLSLKVAVDFTASNGDPNDPRSLHFYNSSQPNCYQDAIRSVGNILQAYDSDGIIGAFGFGGVFQGEVSHCFPLSGSSSDVNGIDGVMAAYQQSLSTVALSGPTYFAPLIETVTQIAYNPEQSQRSQTYTILLILTDGEVMDMDRTKQAIVAASGQALSIVIVGVGSANFGKMVALDSDDELLRSSDGRVAERDIVQFVPFNRFNNRGDLLAKEVLHEIPEQIVSFFHKKRILPNPPLRAPSALNVFGGVFPEAVAVSSSAAGVPVAKEATEGLDDNGVDSKRVSRGFQL